jgi:hypothetical protein
MAPKQRNSAITRAILATGSLLRGRGDARGTDREGLADLLRGETRRRWGGYFPLTPGYRLSYKHGSDTDVVTVLNEPRMIHGVECRVAEDREEKNGQLVELTPRHTTPSIQLPTTCTTWAKMWTSTRMAEWWATKALDCRGSREGNSA